MEHKSKLDSIRHFLRDHHVSLDVCHRVESYYEDNWIRYQGHVAFEYIEGMPKTLHAEICYAKYKGLLESMPLFKQLIPGFTRDLAFDARRMLILPGDLIVHKGDIGKEMYFIMRGVAEILAEDDKRVVTEISEGAYFGEVGMIFQTPRCNSVRAKTHCELIVLSQENLFRATMNYPAIRQIITNVKQNKAHFQAIQSAVKLNEALAIDPDMLFIPSTLPQTFVRNRSRAKKKLSRVSPSPLSVIEVGGGPRAVAHSANPPNPAKHGARWLTGTLWPCIGHSLGRVLLVPYALVPSSAFATLWEYLIMLCCMVTTFTLGFQAAFLYDSTNLLIFHYVIDGIFLVDMFVKFHTAYFDNRGMLITDPTYTARRYLKTNFWLDFIAGFPVEIFALLYQDNVFRALCVFRINRALRAYKIIFYFAHLEKSITRSTGKIRLGRFSFITLVITHWFSCGWFILGCFNECTPQSWAESGEYPLTDMPWGDQYVTAIYWATATMVSVGYGDFTAQTHGEKVYASVVMLVGTMLYGYFIAGIAASIANADFDRSRFSEKIACLQQFFIRSRVDADVAKRVSDHFEYLWLRNNGVQAHRLFEDMPRTMQANLCMEIYKDAIEAVPLFKDKGIGFTRVLSLVMRSSLHLKGEYIVRKVGKIEHVCTALM